MSKKTNGGAIIALEAHGYYLDIKQDSKGWSFKIDDWNSPKRSKVTPWKKVSHVAKLEISRKTKRIRESLKEITQNSYEDSLNRILHLLEVNSYEWEIPEGEEEPKRDLKKESLELLGTKYIFATPDDVEILYLYQDGKYVPAKTIIHEEVEVQHGDDSSSGLCAAVVSHFERRSYVKRTEFNKFDNFMPVENGLLNLTTFELTPHTPDKIFTFKLETAYLPGKKCPKFMKYFNETLPNKEAQQVVQEFSGYTLMPAFPHHYFLFMIGEGRNGKGTLVRTLTGILGVENVAAVPLDQLDGKHRFVVATLFGKLMNICSEPSTKELHPQILKKVTGQDLVHGEIKNKQNPLNFIPFAKWFVLANELPPVNDTTLSFWDRLQLVEYTQNFTDEKGNKITDIELQWLNDPDERAGILNWMIMGLKRLKEQGGITQTKTMKQKKLEYKKASDSIGAFLLDPDQCMYGSILGTLRDALYDAYKNYAEEQGITIETSGKFIARVKLLPNVVTRQKRIGGKPKRIWKGIGLVGQTEQTRITLDQPSEADETDETPIITSLSQDTHIPPTKDNNFPNPDTINGASPASSASLSGRDRSELSTELFETAVRILKEAGGKMQQQALFQALIKLGYHATQSRESLYGDSRFVFMGMDVNLGAIEDEIKSKAAKSKSANNPLAKKAKKATKILKETRKGAERPLNAEEKKEKIVSSIESTENMLANLSEELTSNDPTIEDEMKANTTNDQNDREENLRNARASIQSYLDNHDWMTIDDIPYNILSSLAREAGVKGMSLQLLRKELRYLETNN